jgi:hypothetical protein
MQSGEEPLGQFPCLGCTLQSTIWLKILSDTTQQLPRQSPDCICSDSLSSVTSQGTNCSWPDIEYTWLRLSLCNSTHHRVLVSTNRIKWFCDECSLPFVFFLPKNNYELGKTLQTRNNEPSFCLCKLKGRLAQRFCSLRESSRNGTTDDFLLVLYQSQALVEKLNVWVAFLSVLSIEKNSTCRYCSTRPLHYFLFPFPSRLLQV